MTRLSEVIPRDRFLPLPGVGSGAGAPRRVGVEIEFAGLAECDAAELVRARWGGTVRAPAPYECVVEGTAIGDVRSFLDTALRKGRESALRQLGLELGREVIPVEVVTAPLDARALPQLELLREDLRQAGAVGSRGGMMLSFGLHFNIEVAARTVDSIRPVLTAFALIEDWLRLSDPIDGSRRLMPFVDPYPYRFVQALLDLPPQADMGALIDLYLCETPTRNRSLDMLPLFLDLDAARVEAQRAAPGAVRARPTYHYRLPDSRVDEPAWRIAYEWNRWVLVETVARDAGALARLGGEWRAGATRHDWCARVEQILRETALPGVPA